MADSRSAKFHLGTSLDHAQQRLRDLVSTHERTESIPLSSARNRVLAAPINAPNDVPHYSRAALDGFAVRASDTDGATEQSPTTLTVGSHSVSSGEAVRVHTGSEIPDGADAVVRVERTNHLDDRIEVYRDVAVNNNIAQAGEDVRDGQHLYDAGHRLRPSDLGLLRSTGIHEVTVYERPRVTVLPTGEEIVETDPEPGEVIETNSLTIANLIDTWGGAAHCLDVVPDTRTALVDAISTYGDTDLLVTIGGSSVGDRDLVPDIVDSLGEVLIHGVSIKPGHPVGIGTVNETPTLLLPGYPVSCIITAVQFVRPAIQWLLGRHPHPFPRVTATLSESIESNIDVRQFVRVRLNQSRSPKSGGHHGVGLGPRSIQKPDSSALGGYVAVPMEQSGAGVLSSVALADGWVEIPEGVEDLPAGRSVCVQDWEWSP